MSDNEQYEISIPATDAPPVIQVGQHGMECRYTNEHGLVSYDDLDEALIGQAEYWDKSGEKVGVLVYSVSKAVELLSIRDKMSCEDALEYIQYNYENAYLGPHTPIWVYDIYD